MMIYRRIAALRKKNGWSQKELSEMLSCSRQTYRRYEQGKTAIPPKIIAKLAGIYHTSADYLLDQTDIPTPYPPIS